MPRPVPAGLVSLCAVALVACADRGGQPPGSSEQPGQASAAVRMEGHFPNVVLTTHENEEVRFYDDLIKGKTVLVSLMYTNCGGICPRTTATLLGVQRKLGKLVGRDVFIYSITLDPATDSPAVLEKYAQEVGAGPGWVFLTGSEADIDLVRRRLGLYDPDPIVDADKTQHGGLIVYGNESVGRWAAIPGLLTSDSVARAVLRVVGPAAGA